MDKRKEVGRRGEDIAAQYLVSKGWGLIARNWSTNLGELDIVAHDGLQLIIVEVRTTTSNQYGLGFQSVQHRKQQQVRKLALQFISQRRLGHLPIRFDVVSILLSKNWEFVDLNHLEGAF
ncbi:YraN family protein [Shimazuella sp. AN120528]|uniref:YraN family protein n=1 Tax=Shimazuella soli TaxID=1892854 RepID=UPI001F0D685A|nr:YraN family protein [Shimazuella soli]MCH5584986.1 YraN family protein [Shimazuella soli]